MLSAKEIGKETIERIDPRTTGGIWAKVRNVAAIVGSVGGLVLLAPITLPATVTAWITWVTIAAGTLSGASNLDKSKLLKNK